MDFNYYWQQLWYIKENYDLEQYYDEIIRPLLNEITQNCNNTKLIPTYDTRCHNASHYNTYKCIIGTKENLVWPDYIFVSKEYTHHAPVAPYVKVEFKKPNIKLLPNKKMVYYSIYATSHQNTNTRFESEISSELSSCPLILTDGITWLFLNNISDITNIETEDNLSRICFLDLHSKYYKGHYTSLVSDASTKFEFLKKQTIDFLQNSIGKKNL